MKVILVVGVVLKLTACHPVSPGADANESLAGPVQPGKTTQGRFTGSCQDESTLERRFPPPREYERVVAETGSFTAYLRALPLKPEGSPVRLYDGSLKPYQEWHEAVIDLDIGTRDLQQCADAVIRLRAEYLFSQGMFQKIHFCFTSGDTASFSRWARGERPVIKGNDVYWKSTTRADSSYASLLNYLDIVFTYAGTLSLQKELVQVEDVKTLIPGDVFIVGGSPGHAVLVADVAENKRTGNKCFILVQGFMPAQEIHVLKNPENNSISPWIEIPDGDVLKTPEWTFHLSDLRRFRD